MPRPPTCTNPALSCVVLNPNGLRCQQKRRTLFSGLMERRYDVAVICEAHSRDDAETLRWVQEGAGAGRPWDGQAFWSHGTSQSRGVGILLSRAALGAKVSFSDTEGRVVAVTFTTADGQVWAVVAVYGPVELGDRAAFFQGPVTAACAAQPPGATLLMAGDYNCVTSVSDVSTGQANPQQNSRLVGGSALQDLQELQGLTDVWRQLHPQSLEFTRLTRSATGVSQGRTTRWLVSQDLLDACWRATCDHMHGELPGDHAAVALKLQPPDQPLWGQGTWAFPVYLLGVPEYVDGMKCRIERHLAAAPAGLSAAQLWDDLKIAIKHYTLGFSYQRAASRRSDRTALQQRVHAALVGLSRFPFSGAAAAAYQAAVKALQQHDEAQGSSQGSTLDALWGVYGEQSTMWFHRLGRTPKEQQPIRTVKHPSGDPGRAAHLCNPAGAHRAGELLADFYDGLLPSGLFHPATVDTQAQDLLLQAVDASLDADGQAACTGPTPDGSLTRDCLKAALKVAPRGKRPGCDGLPYEFYQAFWNQLAGPMLAAFNEPFLSAAAQPAMSELSRTGIIVLIYKGGDKDRCDPDSYRPITLLNCDVKLVAKVMVQRMGPALDAVIDTTQSAFVPGRWIGDNVLHHLEEIDYVQRVQLPACIVGLDFNKAYDRVHRGWLQRCMETLGLPACAQRWVGLLLEGSRGHITYNNFLSRAFSIDAGCAQGSPLSPLLYVMVAQPLAARCRQLQAQQRIGALLLPDGSNAPVIHQHADDTTIHTPSVADAQTVIVEAVGPFGQGSGAKVSIPKSWGLTLGSHPPIVGVHAATGICFKPPSEATRHLGVPLSSGDLAPHVTALYRRKLQGIAARIRHWSRLDLCLVGRAHVAKQVLASTLSYQATFLAVPEAILASITRLLLGYVLKGILVEEGGSALRGRPSQQACSLPKEMGGIGLVDLTAHVQALQAKVAALLLHPRRFAWKSLMAASFAQAFPGLGPAVLARQCCTHRVPAALPARHQDHLKAFARVGVHRYSSQDSMSKEQIARELLVGNHSVAGADGHGFSTVSSLPAALQQYRFLGDVPPAKLALLCLPAGWVSTLLGPSSCKWEVSPAGDWVRHYTGVRWEHFKVNGFGCSASDPAPLAAAPLLICDSDWAPACMLVLAHPRNPDQVQWYLVGSWATVSVDPNLWGFGTTALHAYTVREGTTRILQWQCRQADGWVAGAGLRPKLWGPGGDVGPARVAAVADAAARQQQRYADAVAAPGPSTRSATRPREEDLAPLYHASWMDPSPPRLHVRQRVEDRAACVTQQRAAQEAQQALILEPLINDTLDPVSADHGDAPPVWMAAWRRAHHQRLPRPSRVFAWRLLHGALRCGGATIVFHRPGALELCQCLCRAPACAAAAPPPVETLLHLFMECPVGKTALTWLSGLWELMAPTTAPPPFLPHVWLADDQSTWQPPRRLAGLWVLLRVTMLKRIWLARCACVLGGAAPTTFTAGAVVEGFVGELRSLILQDWLRVEGDIRQLSGVCPSWFRGRDPALPSERFHQWWCEKSVLASVSNGRLTVHLTRRSVPSCPL